MSYRNRKSDVEALLQQTVDVGVNMKHVKFHNFITQQRFHTLPAFNFALHYLN